MKDIVLLWRGVCKNGSRGAVEWTSESLELGWRGALDLHKSGNELSLDLHKSGKD